MALECEEMVVPDGLSTRFYLSGDFRAVERLLGASEITNEVFFL